MKFKKHLALALVTFAFLFCLFDLVASNNSSGTQNLEIQQLITKKITTQLQNRGNQLIDMRFGYWMPQNGNYQTYLSLKFLSTQSELLKMLRIAAGMIVENGQLEFSEITIESAHSYQARFPAPIISNLGMKVTSLAQKTKNDSESKRARVYAFFADLLERMRFNNPQQAERQTPAAWLDSIRVTSDGHVQIKGRAQDPDSFYQLGKHLLQFKGLADFQVLSINQITHDGEALFSIECMGKILDKK